jgi:general secretion pathway protein D
MKKIVIAVIFGLMLVSAQAPPATAPQPPATPPPAAAQPAAAQPAAPRPAAPQPAAPAKIPMGSTNLENASLTLVIDQLARLLKLNIIVDPAVKGSITLNTYGDTSGLDARNMLEMILRINNFGLIQDGDLYRVLPLKSITHLPMHPEINQKNIPEDDQTILNLVFLKYVNVDELVKVLKEFAGENSDMIAYPPANLLFLLDSRRNMRRTMELISEFDSDTFANQRVRLYEIKNVKPSDLAKDLDSIFKSISLDAKSSPVRFIGVDRINTMIAVASNPGAFENVSDWLKKLDIPVKITAGSIENYVYRVKYGRADCLGQALTQLFNPGFGGGGYGINNQYAAGAYAASGYNGGGGGAYGGGAGGFANNAYGGGGGGYGINQAYGGGSANPGGYGNQNSFNSNFGGSGGCNATGLGGGGGYGGGYNAAQPYGYPTFGGYNAQTPAVNATGQPITAAAGGSLIGSSATAPGTPNVPLVTPPRIIPNPLDNKLIIQANQEQYQNILKILTELDVPPRQILLEAKIYSVTLSDAFTSNVTATLAPASAGGILQLLGSFASTGLVLNGGMLVGQSRQLLLALSASENRAYTKLLSEPSLIATDSIPATINVGTQIPVTTGSTLIPSGGNVTSTSSISSQSTGITLQVNARINSSGVVTLIINQQISAVDATATTNASTPAFDQQVVQTQITMMDGDTIAIGGLISETYTNNGSGVPGLIRIPWLGWLFGSKSVTKARSELIMFFTPHVIFDENQLIEASDELKARVKMLKKSLRRM